MPVCHGTRVENRWSILFSETDRAEYGGESEEDDTDLQQVLRRIGRK